MTKTSLGTIYGLSDEAMRELPLRIEWLAADGATRSDAFIGSGTEYFMALPEDAKRIKAILIRKSDGEEKILFRDKPLAEKHYDEEPYLHPDTGAVKGDFRLNIGVLRYATLRVWSEKLDADSRVSARLEYRGPQTIAVDLAYNADQSERDGRATFDASIDSGILGVKEIQGASAGGSPHVLFANIAFEDVFRFRIIPQGTDAAYCRMKFDCYRVSRDGEIDYATDEGHQGTKNYPNIVRRLTGRTEDLLVVVFPCRSVSLFDILDSRYLAALDVMKVLSPGDSEPERYAQVLGLKKSRNEGFVPLTAAAFIDPEEPLKLLMSSDFFGVKYLLVNAPDHYIDRKYLAFDDKNKPIVSIPPEIANLQLPGYAADMSVIFNPSYQVARDLWLLDESRTRKLAKFGVKNNRLDELHRDAYVKLVDAKEALQSNRYSQYVRDVREAWGLEARAYPDVKATAVDTVKGIIFYFALLLPFSFFMERLLIGAADFRKQIMGVCAMFVLAFFVLRYVHPAFKISDTPYVIFLAFVILVLGALVMFTVVMKFTAEVKKMKAEASGIVEADVGRLSATYSAIILGISNLRKRKVRTSLTAATIIVLTFTVLSFTSVQQTLKFWRIPVKDNCPYPGAMLRSRDYRAFQTTVESEIKAAFEGVAKTARRNWKTAPGFYADLQTFEIHNRATGKSAMANGFVGMEPEEAEVPCGFEDAGAYRVGRITDMLKEGSRWILPEERAANVVILPEFIADKIGVDLAQVAAGTALVRIFTRDYKVIGIADEALANQARLMDFEPITPIDMSAASAELLDKFNNLDPTQVGGEEMEALKHLSARTVPIMPYETLEKQACPPRSVAIYDFADTEGRAYLDRIEDFMRRVSVTLYVGDGERVQVYSSVGAPSFSGLGKLFIPILIVAAMVLNTMMGAVYERFREIGIYSSVGLAPNHVGALFLAESFVFATVGAVIGYLLSQILAFFLTAGNVGLLQAINLNYSSLSAVAATMIVMATVLVSTIYPSRKASEMAVPDVSRKWKLDPPASDSWTFVFPFTIAGHDAPGLNVFLRDYFAAYEENSVGDFFTRDVTLAAYKHPNGNGKAYKLSMDVWLAPYDMSISQRMELESVPTGEHEVYEVHVRLDRLSGEVRSWIKMNHDFLNILRKRFLVWRTVPRGMKLKFASRIEESVKAA